MVKIVFKNFGILNHIFVKMKIRIQKHGKTIRRKVNTVIMKGTPLVILWLMEG
jgi:hypothetical protein